MGEPESNYEMTLYKKLIDELYKIPTRDLFSRPSMVQEKISIMRLKLEGYFQGLKEAKEQSFLQIDDNYKDDDLLMDDISPSCKKVEITHLWTDPNPPKIPPRIQGPQ